MALYRSPEYQTSFKLTDILVQEEFKIYFQDGGCGSHLGFLIGTILANFILQIIPILPTKILVSLPFVS